MFTQLTKLILFCTLLLTLMFTSQAAAPAHAQGTGPFAYIANSSDNTVSVIDTSTNSVVATVVVGGSPYGVAVNSTGTRVYVSNAISNDISVIDTSNNNVISTIAVGTLPRGIAVNSSGTRVYVANGSSNNVSVIDTSNNSVVATIPVGTSPFGIVVNPTGTLLYVTNQNSVSVSVIDTGNNSVVATVTVGTTPRGVTINPVGTRVYVANYNSDNISVIDTSSNGVIATMAVGDGPQGITVNPTGTRVYVTNRNINNVSVIDTNNNSVVATVVAGDSPTNVGVNQAGTRVYVVNTFGNNVSVIDTSNNSVVATVAVGSGPYSLGQFIGPVLVATPTPTFTASPTNTATATPTSTLTPKPTNTPVTPNILTATPTLTPKPTAKNIDLISQFSGTIQAVFVQGNYAYVGMGPRLAILDITNPTQPTKLGETTPLPDNVQEVYVTGNYAYVADYTGGLKIINISNPTAPSLIGSYNTSGGAVDVQVVGNYAYVVDGHLQIINISNPAAPSLAGSYSTELINDVYVVGNYAYVVGNIWVGLKIINISNPATPSLVNTTANSGSLPGNSSDVYIMGDYAYITYVEDIPGLGNKGLKIVNISNSSAPSSAGGYDALANPQSIYVTGNYAYVADGTNGLQVINLNVSGLAGSYDTSGFAQDVRVMGSTAYVADGSGGLLVLGFNDPTAPTATFTPTPVSPTPDTPTPTFTPTPTATPTNTPVLGQIKISGQILNGLNIGIDGVTVTFGNQSAITDNDGNYTVSGITGGTYSPSFSKNGYTFSNYPSIVEIQSNKTINTIGHYTAANVDSGFRPNPNGYNFQNKGYTNGTWDLFKKAFPDTPIENNDRSRKQGAELFFNQWFKTTGQGGNCRGFSHSSLINYAGLTSLEKTERDVLSSPNNNAQIHDMIDRNDVRDYINIYQARFFTVKSMQGRQYGKPNDVLQLIKDALADFKDNALDVAVFYQKEGHSVVPYRVEQNGTIAKVYVYDNNHRNSESQYIQVDTSANKWTYNLWGTTVWQGTDGSIYVDLAKNNFPAVINVSRTRQNQVIPMETNNQKYQVIIDGNVSTIFTDDSGKKLGVVGGQIVNEIDNAKVEIVPAYDPNQPDTLASVVYLLPLTQSYTLQAYAETNEVYTVTAFANGMTTQLSDVDTVVGATDEIVLGENLRQMTLEAAGSSKDYCYFFADDKLNDASRSFNLCATTSPGGIASFNVAPNNEQFTFENSGQPSTYTLTIAQTGQQPGSQTVTGETNSTTPLTVAAVPGSGPGGSNWAVTGSTIYLPLIIK